MSILAVEPWGAVQKAILYVGSAWPIAKLVASGGQGEELVWLATNAVFMAFIFGVPAVIASALVLPTYKSRIVAVPPLLIILFWAVSSQSDTYAGFQLPPAFLLWLTTYTAVTLILPERKRGLPI